MCKFGKNNDQTGISKHPRLRKIEFPKIQASKGMVSTNTHATESLISQSPSGMLNLNISKHMVEFSKFHASKGLLYQTSVEPETELPKVSLGIRIS